MIISIAWVLFVGCLFVIYLQVGGKLFLPGKTLPLIDIRFFGTEQDADCILISDGKSGIMIDTGEAIDGKMILKEMEGLGIKSLDYLILTHPDKDHIGGALEILQMIPIANVIQPYYNEHNEDLVAINQYCEENNIPIYYPNRTWRIELDYLRLVLYPSLERHYKDNNNYSLAVLATHGDSRMFFAGDAKKKRLEELLKINLPEVNLYKVAHHGRENSATRLMFDQLKPTYAVVTSTQADKEVVDSCLRWGTELLYTGGDTVHFQSDGKRLYPMD